MEPLDEVGMRCLPFERLLRTSGDTPDPMETP